MVCRCGGSIARHLFTFPVMPFCSSWRNTLNCNRAVSNRDQFGKKDPCGKFVVTDTGRKDNMAVMAFAGVALVGYEKTGRGRRRKPKPASAPAHGGAYVDLVWRKKPIHHVRELEVDTPLRPRTAARVQVSRTAVRAMATRAAASEANRVDGVVRACAAARLRRGGAAPDRSKGRMREPGRRRRCPRYRQEVDAIPIVHCKPSE
jgi:hypothetical protein